MSGGGQGQRRHHIVEGLFGPTMDFLCLGTGQRNSDYPCLPGLRGSSQPTKARDRMKLWLGGTVFRLRKSGQLLP